MLPKLLTLLISGFFFLTLTHPAFAAVYVNEFLPNPSGPSSEDTEWIEIYNSDSSSIDLTGWQIDDESGGSTPYTIPSGTMLTNNGFLVFEKSTTNIALNNTGDSVRILNSSGSEIDVYSYPSSTTEDISYGRITDGGSTWSTFSATTKGSSNNSGTPIVTPTPTNTNTPTPTKTPTNTPTPTSASSSTPTNTPTPTKKPTSTPTPTKGENLSIGTTKIGTEEAVLGLNSAEPTPTDEPPADNGQRLGLGKSFIAGGLALIGVTFLGLSGYSLYKGQGKSKMRELESGTIIEDEI
ncbi:MAG: lamin tail domain-containing protein [bacterium]|nr:lamin tail domain-containing protein [bacterium]